MENQSALAHGSLGFVIKYSSAGERLGVTQSMCALPVFVPKGYVHIDNAVLHPKLCRTFLAIAIKNLFYTTRPLIESSALHLLYHSTLECKDLIVQLADRLGFLES